MSEENEVFETLSYEERALAKRAKLKKAKGLDEPGSSLNINSMMDMMTVILCFLLFNVGADPLAIKQSDDLRLPVSMIPLNPEITLTILVSQSRIIVDDRMVLSLDEGQINESDLPGRDARIVPELQRIVEEAMETQARVSAQLNRENRPAATLIIDGRTPFSTVSRVLSSAQAGGVSDLRIATQRLGARESYGGEGIRRVP